MAESPARSERSVLSIDILINGSIINNAYVVDSISINRQVNKIASAHFSLLLTPQESEKKTYQLSESEEFIPGNEVEIKAGYEGKNESIFKGIIISQGLEIRGANKIKLEVFCKDKAVSMTTGTRSQYYADSKDSDVLANLASNHGLGKSIDSTSELHPVLVQYQTTDWDFMITRAQSNGLLVNTQDGKLIIEKPKTGGSPLLTLTYGEDVYSFQGAYDADQQPPSISAFAWNQDTQQTIEEQSTEPTIAQPGNFDTASITSSIGFQADQIHTDGDLSTDRLQEWANARLTHSRLALFKGKVKFIGNEKPQINSLLELSGFGKRFSGLILVTGVEHIIEEGNWATTVQFGIEQEWFYEKVNTHAPLAGGLLPAAQGLHIGRVKNIVQADPNNFSILVQIPSIDNQEQEVWARMAQTYAGNDRGFFFYPEIDDEVVVGFINNDPRFPVILGSLYSNKNNPAYVPSDDNALKAIVSKAKLKIEFDDTNKILHLETPGGHQIILSDKDNSITIKSTNDISFEAEGNISFDAKRNLSLKSTEGNIDLEGINIKAKANASFEASANAASKVTSSGTTTIQGAMVMIN